jgi:hypothetical protein
MKFILNEKGLVAAKRWTYINIFLCVRVVEFSIGFSELFPQCCVFSLFLCVSFYSEEAEVGCKVYNITEICRLRFEQTAVPESMGPYPYVQGLPTTGCNGKYFYNCNNHCFDIQMQVNTNNEGPKVLCDPKLYLACNWV